MSRFERWSMMAASLIGSGGAIVWAIADYPCVSLLCLACGVGCAVQLWRDDLRRDDR